MLHAVYPISKEALSIQGSGQLGLTCETLQDCTSRARRHGRYGFSFRDCYLRLSDSGSRRRRDCRHGGGSMGKQGDGSWASSPKAKLSASATVGAGSSLHATVAKPPRELAHDAENILKQVHLKVAFLHLAPSPREKHSAPLVKASWASWDTCQPDGRLHT